MHEMNAKKFDEGAREAVSINDGGLRAFFVEYVDSALRTTNDESTPSGGVPLDRNYGPGDVDIGTAYMQKKQCREFLEMNAPDLEGYDLRQAGADFWLTRNRHGAGFWDGDYEEPQATRLTDASHKFREVNVIVGDNGKLYFEG